MRGMLPATIWQAGCSRGNVAHITVSDMSAFFSEPGGGTRSHPAPRLVPQPQAPWLPEALIKEICALLDGGFVA
jgi:hypothetical protein